jgi:hypothetical protein
VFGCWLSVAPARSNSLIFANLDVGYFDAVGGSCGIAHRPSRSRASDGKSEADVDLTETSRRPCGPDHFRMVTRKTKSLAPGMFYIPAASRGHAPRLTSRLHRRAPKVEHRTRNHGMFHPLLHPTPTTSRIQRANGTAEDRPLRTPSKRTRVVTPSSRSRCPCCRGRCAATTCRTANRPDEWS